MEVKTQGDTDEMAQGIENVTLETYLESDKKASQALSTEDMQTGEPPTSSSRSIIQSVKPTGIAMDKVGSTPSPGTSAAQATATTSSVEQSDKALKKRRPYLEDMDVEDLEIMMMRGPYMPPEIRRELREYGVPEKLLKHMNMRSPDMQDVMRPRDSRPQPAPLRPHRSPSNWNEPIGRGHKREEIQWSSPEPGVTPQTLRLDDSQVLNSAGGYVYKLDDMGQVRRLLCLGTDSGTYYQSSKELTEVNLGAVDRLLEAKRGTDLVAELVKFKNRVARMNPLLFVLAKCAKQNKDLTTKRDAYRCLSEVCTIPTHLFIFMEYYSKLPSCSSDRKGRGWGRAHRYGIANWYLHYKEKPYVLAMHVTKYKQRNGWSHRDVIRQSHPKPSSARGSPGLACVVKYVVKGLDAAKETYLTEEADNDMKKILSYLEATEEAKKLTPHDEEKACELIKDHGLVREHLPTELLNSVEVWRALLKKMPMHALIRNLGKMSKIELLKGEEVEKAVKKLTDFEQIKRSRIHPYKVFVAYHQYKSGRGDKGSLSWSPNGLITKAVEDAFYLSFKAVEPTNKRFCIALDISSSMDGSFIMGSRISVREASAAMSMVTVRTEKRHNIIGFHHNMIPLEITPDMNLDAVVRESGRHGFGSTDCAKPMVWAMDNRKLFDVFIVYTDSETYAGSIHPKEAMRRYREASGIADAKLIVVGMTSNKFTIADPEDANMLDIVGFDSDAPDIIRNFVLGEI